MKKFRLFPKYSDRYILLSLIGLMIFGTLMIASAEMGSAAGDAGAILNTLFKQAIYLFTGFLAYVFFSNFSVFYFHSKLFYPLGAVVVAGILLITRLFDPVGGAYAWLRFGSFTIQPSEFAKVFMIVLIAKMFTQKFKSDEEERNNFRTLFYIMLAYFIIIFGIEKDTGSAVILFGISYLLLLLPKSKAISKWQRMMILLMFVGFALIIFILSPIGTMLLEKLGSGNYMIGRFLAANNPFKDQYSTGYHLVMSLVAFATGGIFGVGYGNSVHKYMNFPNPSNDFILPVIVEELGLFGLTILVLLYAIIIIRLARHATSKNADLRAKIVLLGVILYFALHFILNVGGVSGLIPLTGVPLLLVSSGGSSAMAAMLALGIAQSEINRIRSVEVYD